MQRDRRLAGAGAALNDERSAQVRADDTVLLRLDRRDDVVHPPRSLGSERREEGTLPLHDLTVCHRRAAASARLEQRLVEHLVVDAQHLPLPHGQVTSRADPERLGGGRLVERTRLRGTPVDQKRTLVVVTQPDPADVAVRRVVGRTRSVEQQPAEDQPRIHFAQLGQLILVESSERVPLTPRLMVAADALATHIREPLARLGTQRVQPFVERCDDSTLTFEFRFLHAHPIRYRADSLRPPAEAEP